MFVGCLHCNLYHSALIPYPSTVRQIHLPLNTFNKCHPGNDFCPGEVLRQNKGKALSLSFGEPSNRSKQDHKCLRMWSMLLPLALATCIRNGGCYLHGHCSSAEWGSKRGSSECCFSKILWLLFSLSVPLVVVRFLLGSRVLKELILLLPVCYCCGRLDF